VDHSCRFYVPQSTQVIPTSSHLWGSCWATTCTSLRARCAGGRRAPPAGFRDPLRCCALREEECLQHRQRRSVLIPLCLGHFRCVPPSGLPILHTVGSVPWLCFYPPSSHACASQRLRLSDNSIPGGAAIPCNRVVSALRRKNALSLGSPSKKVEHRGRPGGSELPGQLATGCGCRSWSWQDRCARAVAEWCGCRYRVGAGEWRRHDEMYAR
jgi:hypothetical protein